MREVISRGERGLAIGMPADGNTAPTPVESTAFSAHQTEAAEHERQFREMLEHCPAGLVVVDEDGRLIFHNARLREMLGYSTEEMELIDTRTFWHDLDHRLRIIETLRDRGGTLLNEEVIYKTKQGHLIHVLMSYVQVAYRGGHVSFVGGKRLCWVYDISALRAHEAQVAEQERQFREILEYCPAGFGRRRRGWTSALPQRAPARAAGIQKEELASHRHKDASGTTSITARASSKHFVSAVDSS